MLAVFRTDASLRIGTGHVMRCLTLAEELRSRGAQAVFVCRELEGNLIALIREARGFPVLALPRPEAAPAPSAGEPFHASWLGVPWSRDSAETREALSTLGRRPDWLVVDHYALDARWEAEVKPAAGGLLVIDDIADRPHLADFLLDQNLYDRSEARYAGFVPPECRLLLGPEFALLRPEFAEARRRARVREGRPRRVLIFFGGADPGRDTAKALAALSHPGRPALRGLEADVVVGAVNPEREAVRALCEARPGTAYHCQVSDMAGLMAKADLALGAGGTASWERCCVGLPSLLASVAENQMELTATLARHGAAVDLGWGPDLDAERIAAALDAFLADPAAGEAMSRLCLSLVDGGGAARVAERLLRPEPGPEPRLRPAEAADMLTYFRWTNDPETRLQSFRSEPVPLADHDRWFRARLADPHARLYVAEVRGEPAGQIRFQRERDEAWISFSVDPRHRGRGLGGSLLALGPARLREEPGWERLRILGAVKRDNPASHKAFLRAGYCIVAEDERCGAPTVIYAYPEGQP